MNRPKFFAVTAFALLLSGAIRASGAESLASVIETGNGSSNSYDMPIAKADFSFQVGRLHFRFLADSDKNNFVQENKDHDGKIERDGLIAQQIAAAAAQQQVNLGIFQTILSAFGAIVAALGAYFVVLTLRETRKTANAAIESAKESAESTRVAQANLSHYREVSRFDLRPWLTLDAKIASDITFEEKGLRFYVRVRVSNVGKLPASRVMIIAEADNAFGIPNGKAASYFNRAFSILESRIKDNPNQMGLVLVPNEWTEADHGVLIFWEDIKRGYGIFNDGRTAIFPCIYISATYCDLSGDQIVMQTCKTFHVSKISENEVHAKAIILEDGEVSINNLGISNFNESRVV